MVSFSSSLFHGFIKYLNISSLLNPSNITYDSIKEVNSITMIPESAETYIETTGGGTININSLSSPGSGGINLNDSVSEKNQ